MMNGRKRKFKKADLYVIMFSLAHTLKELSPFTAFTTSSLLWNIPMCAHLKRAARNILMNIPKQVVTTTDTLPDLVCIRIRLILRYRACYLLLDIFKHFVHYFCARTQHLFLTWRLF